MSKLFAKERILAPPELMALVRPVDPKHHWAETAK